MKRILKPIVFIFSSAVLSSCGNGFLNTEYYEGIDVSYGLTNVDNVKIALNGTYEQLMSYYFAGAYSVLIGDIPTDIPYWNAEYGHFDTVYKYIYTDTDKYITGIWNYGCKIIDNSARIIHDAKSFYDSCTDSEKAELDLYLAEAYALRGYARLVLVNVYGHQAKVAGQDYTSLPGIVIEDEPIEAYAEVSRATVGESYEALLSDFENALDHFEAAGGDRGNKFYIGKAATLGLLARANLYLENWNEAASYARRALEEAGISSLAYDEDSYKALYYDESSNSESFFRLAVSATDNNGDFACGTYWSTYGFSPSVKAQELYNTTDCRTSIFTWNSESTPMKPKFGGGKYAHFSSGNPAYGTCCLVNAPEQFLIIAEADYENGDLDAAKDSLLVVAKRDAAITSVSDLPSSSDDFLAFLKDERARELFQEGHRLFDLRRYGEKAEVYAYGAPDKLYTYTDYDISDLIFPIPADEVNAGFGVDQNEGWSASMPHGDSSGDNGDTD